MPKINKVQSAQAFKNGEIHDWYRIVLGYSDHLVSDLIDELGFADSDARILDPFCGAGTTLVECKKRGLRSVGIDANPSSCFASSVKTRWTVDPSLLRRAATRVGTAFAETYRRTKALRTDTTYTYILSSGMLERGWITERPLLKAIAAKHAVLNLSHRYDLAKPTLLLALMADFVHRTSNVKFGPELYCSVQKDDVDVLKNFNMRVTSMANDLDIARVVGAPKTNVYLGDARALHTSRTLARLAPFDAVICSPPYPTEHDYTRNARLELAFLEQVSDLNSLRVIKKRMLRSHTKGIYISDEDEGGVQWNKRIGRIVNLIKAQTPNDAHGFAQLYPTVVRQYFGGMALHLQSVRRLLRRRATCMYIVGDQASYYGIHIPTAEILGTIAERNGYDVLEIRHWRTRRPTNGNREIAENILVLRRR